MKYSQVLPFLIHRVKQKRSKAKRLAGRRWESLQYVFSLKESGKEGTELCEPELFQ